MLQGVHAVDWLRYNASYDIADERFGFRRVGKNVRIHCLAIIPSPEQVELGDHVRIDAFTILSAKEIVIGSYVHIGAHCLLTGRGRVEFQDFGGMGHGGKIFTSTDDISVPGLTNPTVPDELHPVVSADVVVEKHAFVCTDAILMPGVRLGFGSIAAAKAYVDESVRSYSIVGGVPAKFLKERTRPISEDALAELERRCREMI